MHNHQTFTPVLALRLPTLSAACAARKIIVILGVKTAINAVTVRGADKSNTCRSMPSLCQQSVAQAENSTHNVLLNFFLAPELPPHLTYLQTHLVFGYYSNLSFDVVREYTRMLQKSVGTWFLMKPRKLTGSELGFISCRSWAERSSSRLIADLQII